MRTSTPDAQKRADARLGALLPRLIDTRRQMARLQAEEASLLAEARAIAEDWVTEADARVASEAEFSHRSIAAEIAAAWRVSDRTVQRQISEAAALVADFPETHAALAAGDISAAHARVILAAGIAIERPEMRADFEASILDYARSESASRLAPIAKARAEWCAETTFDDRHRAARTGRRVWAEDLDDGMGELHIVGPAVLVRAAHDRLTRLAHAVTDDSMTAAAPADASEQSEVDDRRTIDQLRADILFDVLLAGDPVAHDTGAAPIHGSVSITVPVLALIDDGVRNPFEAIMLDGHAPIDVDTARALAANAPGWDRILTHPVTGSVLEVDRYRPSEEMRRHLRVRDQHCRFPGCRMPTPRCDADHTLDFARGGQTATENLANLCRRHHTLKHQTSWTVVQRPGGVLEWTSPTGSTYTDRPVSTVAFAPDPECEYDLAPF